MIVKIGIAESFRDADDHVADDGGDDDDDVGDADDDGHDDDDEDDDGSFCERPAGAPKRGGQTPITKGLCVRRLGQRDGVGDADDSGADAGGDAGGDDDEVDDDDDADDADDDGTLFVRAASGTRRGCSHFLEGTLGEGRPRVKQAGN